MNITLDAYQLTYYTNSLFQANVDLLEMIAEKNEASASRTKWHQLVDEEIRGQKAKIARLGEELTDMIDDCVRTAKYGQIEPD